MQNTIGTAWMETANSSFQTPASVSSRPEEKTIFHNFSTQAQPLSLTYCHSLKQTVDGERQDDQKAPEGGQDLLLAAIPLDLSLGGALNAGVRVRAVGLVGRVRDVVDVTFSRLVPLPLPRGLSNLHHVPRVLNSVLNRFFISF